ncbi:hypothetical protein HMPREF1868_00459 [Olsenella sp. DNF00959]|nr:hypothetical protein HMPREF1868_00459 [Olsenella sp. DNF00959]
MMPTEHLNKPVAKASPINHKGSILPIKSPHHGSFHTCSARARDEAYPGVFGCMR